MIQVVLDRLEGDFPADSAKTRTTSQGNDMKNLNTLAKLTEHALVFARSNGPYPAEELLWLATTLFNLAIDMYISSSSVLTDPKTVTNSDTATNRGTKSGENAMTAQLWARRAVEFADVLALGPLDGSNTIGSGPERGDGILAETLRERCQRFKWDV